VQRSERLIDGLDLAIKEHVSALYWREISVVLAFADDQLTGSAEHASA
jgi:hypothetical protein